MRPLHPLDFVFLSLEKQHQPMHVGGLFLFKKPQDPNFIQKLVEQIKQSDQPPIAPFNDVLSGIKWQENANFDIDYHFEHVQTQNLNHYVAEQHAIKLNRKKPLWTCKLIDGFSSEQFALFVKVHHAMVDGIAAMRLMEKAFSPVPDASHLALPWITQKIRTRNQPSKNTTPLLTSTKVVYTELKQALLHDRKHNPNYVTSFQAPTCIFNQKINQSRLFATQSFNLEHIKTIAQALNITINDTILAICSGAIRHYLKSQNQLPSTPLVAMVPASVRNEEDADLSNRLTMILANLATTTGDAIQRAHTISKSVDYAKTRFKRMTQHQIFGYSAFVYSVAGLNILGGIVPKKQAFNIVISNVPGPKETLYWNGLQLQSVYPASVVFDGQALNITLTSYLNKLEVGLVACQDLLPHIEHLLNYMAEEIEMYLRVIKHPFVPYDID